MRKILALSCNKDKLLKTMFITSIISFIICLVFVFIISIFDIEYKLLNEHIFSDFAETISFAYMKNPFEPKKILSENLTTACIYPPIAYMLVYPFMLICKKDVGLYVDNISTSTAYSLDWFFTRPMFIISYVLYFIIFMSLSLFMIAKISKLKGKNLAYLLTSVGLSGAILYSFVRGNTIFILLLCVLCFYYFYYEKESRVLKILGLFLLAIGISIKIYPVFFSVVILSNKDKKKAIVDLIICAIFTVILVFLPFLFTKGGFSNIKLLIDNTTKFTGKTTRYTNLTNIGITSIVYSIFCVVKLFGFTPSLTFAKVVSYAIMAVVFIMALCICLFDKKKTNKFFGAGMLYLICQNVSYSYSIIIFILPTILYFNEFEEIEDKDKKHWSIVWFTSFLSILYVFKIMKIVAVLFIYMCIRTFYERIKVRKLNEKIDEEIGK